MLIVKCGWLKCKIDYKSILPSNHFQKKKNRTERERVSEREPPIVRERETGHLNLRSTTLPFGSCLSPSIKQRSTPPFPHHRSTNTQDPPLRSLTMHRRVQVELRSWQSTVGRAPPGSPMHWPIWPPPPITDLANPDHQPHSTSKPTRSGCCSLHPLWSSLSPISHSFFLLSPSSWIKGVFILIFGCVKCIF